jgi:hypothetical protein
MIALASERKSCARAARFFDPRDVEKRFARVRDFAIVAA